jgi:hypothetical protein
VIPLLLCVVAADFSGTWLYRVEGRNFLVLTLDAKGGTIVRPKTFQMDSDGDVSNVSPELVRLPVKWRKKPGEIRVGSDRYRIRLVDQDHATLEEDGMSWMPVHLQRAHSSDETSVPSSWPQPHYPPEIVSLQERIRAMVDEDQAVRNVERISESRMDEVDRKHRAAVEEIFARHGWPARSVVGKPAAHQFWLLVQHQPLEVQRRMLPAMEQAMRKGEASMGDYAYLYDRIQVGEAKPQRWGTQVKCVNSLPVLSPVEDPAGLDERRRELRLPPMREYLKLLKPQCVR